MMGPLPRYALLVGCVWAACVQDEKPAVTPEMHANGLYLAATTAYAAGKYDEAEKKFTEVAVLNPSDPRLPVAQGELYLAQGRNKEARAAYERAVRNEPARAANHSRLGALLLRLGEPVAAEASLRQALKLKPDDYNAMDVLARIEASRAKVDEAVALYKKAAELAPENLKPSLRLDAARVLGNAKRESEAVAVLEEARQRKEVSDELLADLANRLVLAERYEEALSAYRDLTLLRPQNMPTWQMVGELELRAGRLVQAEEALRKALELKKNASLHAALARVCKRQKNEACAQEELKAAIESMTSDEPLALLAVAEAMAELGRPADGLKMIESLLETSQLKNDSSLLLKAAALAKMAKDARSVKRLCATYRGLDAGSRCP